MIITENQVIRAVKLMTTTGDGYREELASTLEKQMDEGDFNGTSALKCLETAGYEIEKE